VEARDDVGAPAESREAAASGGACATAAATSSEALVACDPVSSGSSMSDIAVPSQPEKSLALRQDNWQLAQLAHHRMYRH
jgi:hypothetical protein